MQATTYSGENIWQAGNPLFHSVFPQIIAGMKTIEELRALPSDLTGSGVYFLWLFDRLVYIGSTKNLNYRINWHFYSWKFKSPGYTSQVPHNGHTILKCEQGEMRDIERAYIRLYRPPYNYQVL
jgi:excinuclease UvrABC nuclease subunit